jgi:hypothetical protein
VKARRLKRLEEENARLKQIVADLTVGKRGAEGSAVKKLLRPASQRLIGLARSTKRRILAGSDDDIVRRWLYELARNGERFGYRRLTVLLPREGPRVTAPCSF